MIFLRDFIAMNSLFNLASRQQPRYSNIRYSFIIFSLYVMLGSGMFLSLAKRMHFVFSSSKWTDSSLSTNQSHTFADSLFKTFLISLTSLCWQKILLSSAHRHAWVLDKACGISFMYRKNDQSPNIDPWGTPQFFVTASEITVRNETKKALFVRYEWNYFIVLCEPIDFILSNKILRSKVSKAFWRSIKITLACFPSSASFKIMSVNWENHGMFFSKTWLVTAQ